MPQSSDFEIALNLCEQDADKLDCVPACIKTVLDHVHPENGVSKEEIMKMVGTSKNAFGTRLSNFVNLNRKLLKRKIPFAFETPDKYESQITKWEKIVEEAANGFPPICFVNRETLKGNNREDYNSHAIIIVGKLGENIKYRDPLILVQNDKGIQIATPQKFNNAWSDTGRSVIFIRKADKQTVLDHER